MTWRAFVYILCALGILCGAITAVGNPNTQEVKNFRLVVPDYSRTSGGYSPALSPDGSTLAYISADGDVYILDNISLLDTGPQDPWQLTVPTESGQGLPTTMERGSCRNIDWSSDGKRVAFGYKDGRLYAAEVIDAHSRQARVRVVADRLAQSNGAIAEVGVPRWSPDGRKIAFERLTRGAEFIERSVYVVDVASGRTTLIDKKAAYPSFVWEQPWSPDSRHIVFSASPDEFDCDLVVASVDGKSRKQITTDRNSSMPSWSPASDRIVYRSVLERSAKGHALWMYVGTKLGSIWVTDSQGRKPECLLAPKASIPRDALAKAEAEAARLQRQLFAKEYRSCATPEQWTRFEQGRLTGDEIEDIAFSAAIREAGIEVNVPVRDLWSGSAKRPLPSIAKWFRSASEQKKDAFIARSMGFMSRSVRPLMRLLKSIYTIEYTSPIWSPDGKQIAFLRETTSRDRRDLCVLDRARNTVRSLFDAGDVGCVSWSSSGRIIVLQSKRFVSIVPQRSESPHSWLTDALGDDDGSPTVNMTPGYPEVWMLALGPIPRKPVSSSPVVKTTPGPVVVTQPPIPSPNSEDRPGEICISPSIIGLRPGDKQRFRVYRLVNGSELPVPGAEWSVDPKAGTITPEGLFTAGATPGTYVGGVKAASAHETPAIAAITVIADAPSGGFALQRTWGGMLDGYLYNPTNVAVDPQGCVYVAEQGGSRVQKFSPQGRFLSRIGGYGPGPGQLLRVIGVGVDALGTLYTLEENPSRVQTFDSAGSHRLSWDLGSSQARPDLGYRTLRSIAVGAGGQVYVSDITHARAFRLDDSGKIAGVIERNGQLDNPYGLCTDLDGNVYITSSFGTVSKFVKDGDYLMQWGSKGSDKGQLSFPGGVAVDRQGSAYVSDRDLCRVGKYDSKGSFVAQWGGSGSAPSQFRYPGGVAVGPDGSVYVADSGNDRMQKFTSDGKFILQWGRLGDRGADLGEFSGMTVSPSGKVYVSCLYGGNVEVLDSLGGSVTKWMATTDGRDQYQSNNAAIGPDGSAYLVCSWGNCIVKLNAQGRFIAKWGSEGSGNGQFKQPIGATVDSAGNVYVIDFANRRIQKFDSSGGYLLQWGKLGSGPGEFVCAMGIATDSRGNVYVADYGRQAVQKFDSSGKYLMQWGSYGTGPGQFVTPWGIAVGPDDCVYVCDHETRRIQKFDSGGKYLSELKLDDKDPTDIAVDSEGSLYVSFPVFHQVNKYAPVGPTGK